MDKFNLAERMLKDQEEGKLNIGKEQHASQSNASSSAEIIKEGVWDDPVLFGRLKTPEIPAEILPSWLGDFAGAVSKHIQTPPAMAVMYALSVVATCLQKRFVVSPFPDYKEPVCIWTLTALPSGSRKTSVVNLMTIPLTTWQDEQEIKMRDKVAENETNRDVINKRIEKLKVDAAKEKDTYKRSALINEINDLKRDMPAAIRFPRLWTGDITPEKLQNLMADHGERMALLSDEGGIFENMSGLYSNGRVNPDIFLKSHAGSSVRVDRGSRPSVSMQAPALTFGLTIQPDLVNDLSQGRKKGFRGNGTLARFLYTMPVSNIGKRDATQRNPILESVKAKYSAGIYSLLAIEPTKDQNNNYIPRILTLSNEAFVQYQKFSQYVESELADGGSLETMRDWGSKLPGAALRLAGLMHVVEYGEKSTVICNETMERALDLCDLLIAHAKAAFDLMVDDQATNDAKYLLGWLLREKRESFNRNKCHTELSGRFRKVERLKAALNVLTGRNIISEVKKVKQDGRGRPSLIYFVNPKIYEENNHGMA